MTNTTTDPFNDTFAEEIAALAAIEVQVLTTYTLADAIREGASVTEQAHGTFGDRGRTCALSAACLAAKARGYAK